MEGNIKIAAGAGITGALIFGVLVGCTAKKTEPLTPAPIIPMSQSRADINALPLEATPAGISLAKSANLKDSLVQISKSLTGHGSAIVQSEFAYSYLLKTSVTGAQLVRDGEGASERMQILSYLIDKDSDGTDFGEKLKLRVAGKGEKERVFTFTYQVTQYGLNLTSTDRVALFESTDGGAYSVLKIDYKAARPSAQLFIIEELGYAGANNLGPIAGNDAADPGATQTSTDLRLHVIQKNMNVAFQGADASLAPNAPLQGGKN